MTFNQHNAYINLPAVTTHANEPQDLWGHWNKVYQICSRSNFFIDGVNATILHPLSIVGVRSDSKKERK